MTGRARVRRIALTGGIATGKSYIRKRLQQLGASVIDSDELARHVIAPGTAGHAEVVRRFGPEIIKATGEIDRDALAAIVFTDARARADLEALIHPRVYEALQDWFERMPPATVAIAEIPLLYETGRAADFDVVIVAACSPEEQRLRIRGRQQLSDAEIQQRLDAQLPIDFKRARADFVVVTSGSLESTDRQIDSLYEHLKRLAVAI